MQKSSFKKLRVINYAIITLIFFSCLLFARGIINLALSKKMSGSIKAEDIQKKDKNRLIKDIMSYAPIVEKNPFGPPGEFYPVTKGQDIKQRSLSELILFGTVTGPEKLNYAIFIDKSQPAPVRQELFTLNNEVYDYGKLTKIQKDYVELTRGANTYKIKIIDTSDMQDNAHSSGFSTASESGLIKKVSENQYLLDQSQVQNALSNPEQVLSDARLYPNIENGRHEGFRILEVKPGGLYEKLGIKNRDILLRINALELTSPEAAMQALSSLQGMNTVNLDIIRNGKKMSMGYQIR